MPENSHVAPWSICAERQSGGRVLNSKGALSVSWLLRLIIISWTKRERERERGKRGSMAKYEFQQGHLPSNKSYTKI